MPADWGEVMGTAATAAEPSTSPARRSAAPSLDLAQRSYRRHVQGRTDIEMMPSQIIVDGREMRFALSSNDAGADQLWAINLHGFFCGGSMYHRESERLAESLGWRILNPSLPGFGGSEPLAWKEISMAALARRVEALLDHFGVERAVLLGHSMGAGVAVEFAATHPHRVLGIIYRDGVATPSWHHRHGLIPSTFATVAPDIGAVADLAVSVAFDIPDLFVGRMLSTLRSVLPDLRRNMKTMAKTAPVASMLMEIDLTAEVAALGVSGIPLLAEWGCFDRIAHAATAAEFAEIAGVPIQWIPGGHSWMLARPSGQSDVLRFVKSGQEFVAAVAARAANDVPRRQLRAL